MIVLGETFIYGHESKQAQAILAACERVGVNPTLVRTTDQGFIVPNEVADELERASVPEWSEQEAIF